MMLCAPKTCSHTRDKIYNKRESLPPAHSLRVAIERGVFWSRGTHSPGVLAQQFMLTLC